MKSRFVTFKLSTVLQLVLWIAFFVFCGASTWEGLAEMASEEQLPENGCFIATNSFPRNSVVEIINLDNNKKIRGIVVGGLDNPWLPALVSREAAEMLDMAFGEKISVKINQPSDATTYLRFTEGLGNTAAAATAAPTVNDANDSNSRVIEEIYRQKEVKTPEPKEDISYITTAAAKPLEYKNLNGSPYFLETEWNENGTADIIDLPEYNKAETILKEEDKGYAAEEEQPVYVTEKELSEYIAEEEMPVFIAKDNVPEYIAEEEKPEYLKDETSELIAEEGSPEYIPGGESDEYKMVAAEERPPESNDVYGIKTETIFPGASITEDKTPEKKPAVTSTPSELIRGRYYVQLAAYSSKELAQSAVNRIDTSFQPVAFMEENKTDSMYRILLGPLNQGESSAVLQRFKSIGYKDAFIRQAR